MSKRQIRISDPEKIKTRLPEFLHKDVNLILVNNSVVTGRLVEVTSDTCFIKNMRLKKEKHPIKNIADLFTDIDA